ncbi:MAG TPA: hypothetical protein VIK25_11430 [Gemmatimonadaceae bacterium]
MRPIPLTTAGSAHDAACGAKRPVSHLSSIQSVKYSGWLGQSTNGAASAGRGYGVWKRSRATRT